MDDQEPGRTKPDAYALIGYAIAAAILLPIGWWLKDNYGHAVGKFILTLGGLLG